MRRNEGALPTRREKEAVIRKLWPMPFSRRLMNRKAHERRRAEPREAVEYRRQVANGSLMSEGGRSRGKRRVFPARHDWRRAIHLADFGRKQKTRALFTSRMSCRRVAGKSSELALGTAAGANPLPEKPRSLPSGRPPERRLDPGSKSHLSGSKILTPGSRGFLLSGVEAFYSRG